VFEKVAVEKCASYDKELVQSSLDKAVDEIDGLSFVKEGMTVGLKVNLVGAAAPEKAVTTHPAIVRRLCERLTKMGARVIIGDSPGGVFNKSYVYGIYKACGLLELEKDFDGKVKLNDDFSEKDAEFSDAVSIKTFSYTGWLDNVDAIINVSKLKTHAMMGMSCAVKNMFGTIPGVTKPQYHMRFPEEMAFANVMVDLNEFFKPRLYIVDAIDGMEGNGPTAGEKRHIGAVLASKKPYALDMVCADIIGMDIRDVQTIRAAYERGLGPQSIKEVEIISSDNEEEIKIADFKRATIHQSIDFSGDGFGNKMKSVLIKLFLQTRPQVKASDCVGCKKCFETFPAQAITMVEKNVHGKVLLIPEIDRSKCIKCFCCQEFCPKGAMKVHENPLGKYVSTL
jgi:uncharacterized protein (DUF362 family)/Pyruvate/2-oxoacid:ferredoxin oxidoreductase delta subunit